MVMCVPPEAALIQASYKADFEEKTDERYKMRYMSCILEAYTHKGHLDPRNGLWKMYCEAKRPDLFAQALILTVASLGVCFHPETKDLYNGENPLFDEGDLHQFSLDG